MTREWSTRRGWTPGATSARGISDEDVARASTRIRLLSLIVGPTPPPLALALVVVCVFIVAETLVVYPLKQLAPVEALGVV
jgi:hypothetical protein